MTGSLDLPSLLALVGIVVLVVVVPVLVLRRDRHSADPMWEAEPDDHELDDRPVRD